MICCKNFLSCSAAAIALSLSLTASEVHANFDAEMLPRVLKPLSRIAPTPPDSSDSASDPAGEGDNLGDHMATRDLVMSGMGIEDVNEITANYIWLGDGNVSGSLFARFFTTHSINIMNGRMQNLADPVADLDAVNLRTVERLVEDASGDNLGDHQATRNLLLNGHTLMTGPVQIVNGQPQVVGGILIQGSNITGLSNPTDPSDAVNKAYVDLVAQSPGPLDERYVRMYGNQTVGGIKTFSSVIKAFRGIDMGTEGITNLKDGVADTDAANIKNVKDLIVAAMQQMEARITELEAELAKERAQ